MSRIPWFFNPLSDRFGSAHVQARVVVGAKFGFATFISALRGNCDNANRMEFEKLESGKLYRVGLSGGGGVFRERGG